MKVLGNLELVGGSIIGAVLEVLGAAPTTGDTGREGQLYLTAAGLGFIDAAGANQGIATAGQLTAVQTDVANKLDLTDGGIVAGGTTFSSKLTLTLGATSAALPALANDVTNKSYVDNLVQSGVKWGAPVDAFVDVLPDTGTASDGDRVILNTDKKIYTFSSEDTAWNGADAIEGTSVFVDGTNAGWRFDGAAWVRFTGTGNQTAGDGLTITGNVLNFVGGNSLTVGPDLVDVKVGSGLLIDAEDGVIIDPAFTAGLLGLGGGVLTGALTLSGAPTADLHAASKKYVDDGIAALKAGISDVTQFVYTAGAAATSHTVTHNLDNQFVNVTVLSETNEVVVPDSITLDSANQLTVTVATAAVIKVVVVG